MSANPGRPDRDPKKAGKERVAKVIGSAAAIPAPAPDLSANETLRRLRQRFIEENGLIFRKSFEEGKPNLFICSRIEVVAETESLDDGGFGILLRWQDRNHNPREAVFGREMFAADCGELRTQLAKGGVTLNGIQAARSAFGEYLNLAINAARAYVTSRTGWHKIGEKTVYVLPDGAVGQTDVRVVFRGPQKDTEFGLRGTLESWQRDIAARCLNNSRFAFAICCGFTGPILHLIGENSFGFNIFGKAQSGKTTCVRVAVSIWGRPEMIGSWRTTNAGMEGKALARNDSFLALDEMSEADPKEIGNLAYFLSNSITKTRADRSGAERPVAQFRTLYLSSGETTLPAAIAQTGHEARAGMEVRCIDLAADAGAGMGVVNDLHGMQTAVEFLADLNRRVRDSYGTACRPFICYLAQRAKTEADFAMHLRTWAATFLKQWLEPFGPADPQVQTVARRFALAAVAGELATLAGVTGWGAGEAERAAHACLRDWISERGTIGGREDEQAVARLRNFISEHGSARFEDWRRVHRDDAGHADPESNPPSGRPVTNRAGWRLWEHLADGSYGWRYCVTAEAMDRILSGLDKISSLRALVARGCIIRSPDGKSSTLMRPPGMPKAIRLYVVPAAVMGAGTRDG